MDKLLILSPEQQVILDHENRGLLIDGVAGSGKTELNIAIIQKAMSQGYEPDDIFVGSFGRKDAEKFAERLEAVMPQEISVRTIHGLSYHIVADDMRKRKLKKWLSEQGTLNLVQGRQRLEIVEEAIAGTPAIFYTMDYAKDIDYLKSVGIHSDSILAKRLATPEINWVAGKMKLDPDNRGELMSCRAAVYKAYQRQMDAMGMVDFGELQFKAVEAIQRDPELLDQYNFKVVIIDEGHDLSEQQWRVVELVAQKANVIRISMSADQSIYSFRGAVGMNVARRVSKMLPVTKYLIENHRSAPQIVAHAEKIFPRGMVATRDIQGSVIEYPLFNEREKHADEIVNIISKWKDSGYEYGKVAVLCRTRNAMPMIQTALTKAKIPNQVGITPFTSLPEVKDLCAWVMLSDPAMMEKHANDKHPFWRVYKAPAIALTDSQGYVIRNDKGIAQTLGSSWQKIATKRHGSLRELLQPDLYPLRYTQAILQLRRNLEYVQTLNYPWDILNYVVNLMTPRYWEYQLMMASDRFGDPMDNVHALMGLARDFTERGAFMNFMNLIDRVCKQDAVEITTVHASKGRTDLQNVILVNTIGDYLHYTNPKEEARIRYVGVTRPQENLVETSVIV